MLPQIWHHHCPVAWIQDAVVGAGAEALLLHGAFEQAFAVAGELAVGSKLTGPI